eukprot:m.359023 g.359023  ORF g.359023 m.359023 type:complete len:1247 (+) comp18374_c0_seq1:602-4342(+)
MLAWRKLSWLTVGAIALNLVLLLHIRSIHRANKEQTSSINSGAVSSHVENLRFEALSQDDLAKRAVLDPQPAFVQHRVEQAPKPSPPLPPQRHVDSLKPQPNLGVKSDSLDAEPDIERIIEGGGKRPPGKVIPAEADDDSSRTTDIPPVADNPIRSLKRPTPRRIIEQPKPQIPDILKPVDSAGKIKPKADDPDAADDAGVAMGDDDDAVVNPDVPFTYRNLLNERKPRIMIAAITGGKKPSVKVNRQAVLDTWFDKDSYFVTRDEVPTDRVIRLSEFAESGGFKMLPRKVKHMFDYMYEHHIDDYDWFIKADDDTFINKERLTKTLSVYNPDIPVYLGKPFASKIKGITGPGPLWQDFTSLGFCHGGAGYILSRALLKLVGPYIREFPHVTSLEDCAVAAVLYHYTGVHCINTNARMFGGLDLVANAHDQDQILQTVQQYEIASPEILLKTATVHSVKANMTRYLHDMYTKLNADHGAIDDVDVLAEKDLESRRLQMVTTWNCTIPSPLPDQSPLKAICQQSALISKPPYPVPHMEELSNAVVKEEATQQCSAPAGQPDNIYAWVKFDDTTDTSMPDPVVKPASGNPSLDSNAVFVGLEAEDKTSIQSLRLLVKSLRAVGSSADVVVVTAGKQLHKHVADLCGVIVVGIDTVQIRNELSLTTSTRATTEMLFFAAFETYLNDHPDVYQNVLYISVDSFFQRNPFDAMPMEKDTLYLFIDYPIVVMNQVECFLGLLRVMERPTKISMRLMYGDASAMRTFFAKSIDVPFKARRCPFDYVLLLNTYRREYSVYHKVVIISPWDGPAAFLSRDQQPQYFNGTEGHLSQRAVFTNIERVPTAVVVGYSDVYDLADGDGLLTAPRPGAQRSALQLVLDDMPARLHDSIKHSSVYTPLPTTQFPFDSKAYLHWSALSQLTTKNIPQRAFRPVWEALSRADKWRSDPTKPRKNKIACPETHETDSNLVSGILFRYAARHGLRFHHDGNWPFIAPEILHKPPASIKEKFDITFSQMSPKGQFHGAVTSIFEFQDHILGPNHVKTLVMNEPTQHYINWLYFFVIAKKKKFPPAEITRDFIKQRLNRNLFTQELGIRSYQELTAFFEEQLQKVDLILVTERLDESLVLLRRRMNWDMLDITYLKLNLAGRRFDGKKYPVPPAVEKLDDDIANGIRDLLPLDYHLYQRVNKRLDELIAEEEGFHDELNDFQNIQSRLSDVCMKFKEHGVCRWYRLSTYETILIRGPEGHTLPLPML